MPRSKVAPKVKYTRPGKLLAFCGQVWYNDLQVSVYKSKRQELVCERSPRD